MLRRNFDFEFKFAEGAAEGAFTGYGAVFGNEDAGGDMIMKGAFKKTLAAWKAKKKLPKMLLQHGGAFTDGLLPIGVWTKMEEDEVGLRVEGQLYGLDTDRGKLVYEGLKTGALDGLSIGYKAVDFKFGKKPEEPWRTIKEVDLYEVSVVLFGMNEQALITDVKSAMAGMTTQNWRDLEAALRDEGLSRADSVKAVSGFKSWLQRDAGEDGEGPRDEVAPEELKAAHAALAERIRALT
ncbi:MAG: HK97 family phage prohead protease [Caulobacter sp.]|nr:HK97 family phage prohead protease [Caulobacter sp.]